MQKTFNFPIDQLKEQILDSLDKNTFLILKSAPGSGKTTRVPIFLLEKFKGRIYVLEPRRLAAKLASQYVASTLNQIPGKLVGHIFKYENKTSPDSQIIFLTEGTFLRILKDKENLKKCDVIILDEFHERHLTTDMALSFILKLRAEFPHLKIIIMSATIDSNKLEEFIGDNVTVLECDQKKFPIEINFLPNDTLVLKDSLDKKVFNAIDLSLETPGDILVFLPGMSEIRSAENFLINSSISSLISVNILHGDLDQKELEKAFNKSPLKKVILATNIAESSVTIYGVSIVIDSGLHRTSLIHPLTKLSEITTAKTSKASAIQRAHRSNREGPGVVYRLYSKLDFELRPAFDSPEIYRSDLSDLILRSFDLFSKITPQTLFEFKNLKFLDPPLLDEVQETLDFLFQIEALDKNGITVLGSQMSKLSTMPRISKIILEASKYSEPLFNKTIDELAAWLEPYQKNNFKESIKKNITVQNKLRDTDIDQLFLQGFRDQIGKLKIGKNLELTHKNGETYKISSRLHQNLDHNHSLWIILELDNRNEVSKLLPIEEEWLYDLTPFPISEKSIFSFNSDLNQLYEELITHIGVIVLEREKKPLLDLQFSNPNKDSIQQVQQLLFKETFFDFEKTLQLNSIKRFHSLAKIKNMDLDNFQFNDWYKNHLLTYKSKNNNWFKECEEILIQDLHLFFDPSLEYNLDIDLPLTLKLSDKRIVEIQYEKNHSPFVASYIQDFYGLKSVPTILKGQEALAIHLLGPHKRALQVTKDIESFWNKTYKEMLNELKRDYPRHYFPDNPKEARPILLNRQVQSK
jgi:ATP-dependent helicase HrpB